MSKKEPEHVISLRKMLEHPENAAVLNHHCDQRIKQAPLDVSEVRRICEHTLRQHRYAELNEDGAVERAVRADSAPASITAAFAAIFASVGIAVVLGIFVSISVYHHMGAKVVVLPNSYSSQGTGAVTSDPNGTFTTFTGPVTRRMLSFKVLTDCWVRVHQLGDWTFPAKVYSAIEQPPSVQVGQGEAARVRSGCPGAIQYFVDGKQAHPVSQSQSDRIELVTLP